MNHIYYMLQQIKITNVQISFIYFFYIVSAASPILPSQSPPPHFIPNPLLLCVHPGKGRSPISFPKTWHIKLQ